jgi:hypothetical protein
MYFPSILSSHVTKHRFVNTRRSVDKQAVWRWSTLLDCIPFNLQIYFSLTQWHLHDFAGHGGNEHG